MRLSVPDIGDEMTLDAPWHFTLYVERRNTDLLARAWGVTKREAVNREYHRTWNRPLVPIYIDQPDGSRLFKGWDRTPKFDPADPDRLPFYLPTGTVLRVERVYIRKGAKDFSSMTFRATVPGEKGTFRFWVKLADANRMEAS